jgi:hypothetical protein
VTAFLAESRNVWPFETYEHGSARQQKVKNRALLWNSSPMRKQSRSALDLSCSVPGIAGRTAGNVRQGLRKAGKYIQKMAADAAESATIRIAAAV